MKKYEHLLEKAVSDIHEEDEKKIVLAIKSRLRRKETAGIDIKDADKEIQQLITDGKITEVDTSIKINGGLSTIGSMAGLCISS